ncbi:2-oxoglutarate ferredoxin oxidoreductase subunit alpha [Nakamurella panacisegetis]|uniref:2-oxoglutarate ferredoxin oxidoreductase subunit alpha n=1 Tax=Nakamurella panacisegetis TaxID=1090615 RepID=A0A1H0QDG6_9ACTN|nr:2-oxoacid:acceptor oxidoreductase subunit alpha [Nakamurella panacisegetis]SDP15392.1 2-oxoglutarate ferredoxin oxidoreductase subunit alpha [Nakamurella panacisegetis]
MTGRPAAGRAKAVEVLPQVVIRFAGDSGDGMQLTGDRFTSETAIFGNGLSTLPDFPAEIRAPAGTLPGVSAFQLQFADHEVVTPGDAPGVLVAMNPAALKANLADLPLGGVIIVDSDEFTARSLTKVGYTTNPLEDGSLASYQVHAVPLTSMTVEAVKPVGLHRKESERAKNMFALGLLSWLYHRPLSGTERFLQAKFSRRPDVLRANLIALEAGWSFGETTEGFAVHYEVKPAPLPPGRYRTIRGNQALAYGLVAASRQTGLPLFLGSYPITPASDILHELSALKNFGVQTFQAEDEIAGVGAAIGASYGGSLGVTSTSGPGIALKSEAIGLAVALELPLIVIDVQRGGPSTGLPTKTEQADLLQVMFGRNGEAPVPVIAARSPSDCFAAALEAARIATTYRTPVFLLSDGYLANGSEPWLIPALDQLPDLTVTFASEPNHDNDFWPYLRDPDTLARPWAIPGTAGLEHRIGGIEKADGPGTISYDPANHDHMVRTRAAKIAGIGSSIADLSVDDPTGDAEILVLGWGSTFGPITGAVRRLRADGLAVAQAHLRHLNPMPANVEAVLRRYRKVVVPEMNLGQLALLLRGLFLVDAVSVNQVRGLPFRIDELTDAVRSVLAGSHRPSTIGPAGMFGGAS